MDALMFAAVKCTRLLGGEQWNDEVGATHHASIDGERTMCGVVIGSVARGWINYFRDSRGIVRSLDGVSCRKCAGKILKEGRWSTSN